MNLVIGKEQVTLSGEQYDKLVQDIERLEQENAALRDIRIQDIETVKKLILEFKQVNIDIEIQGDPAKPCDIKFTPFGVSDRASILIREK